MAFLQQGRFAEAIPIYEIILKREPNNIGAANLLGIAFMQSGRMEEAAEAIQKGLRADPNQPDAHYNLAAVLQALGRAEEAIPHLHETIARRPGDPQALNNLGVALKSLGRHEEAANVYRKAVALKPDYAEALVNLATAVFQLRRYDESIRFAERALALNQNLAEAHLVVGNSLRALGKFDEALQYFKHAIALQPNRPECYASAGNALVESGSHEGAIPYFEKALALKPNSVSASLQVANSLYLIGRYKEAAAVAERGLRNQFVDLHDEIAAGRYMQYLNRHEDSLQHFERAIALEPTSKSALLGYGNTLISLGRIEEAIDYFDRTLSTDKEDNATFYNKALACLTLGRFKEGWKLYEYRYNPAVKIVTPYTFSAPRWDGRSRPETLLIWGEQGLGDQIIYSSLLPEVIGSAEKIVFMVEKRLMTLIGRSFPELHISTFDEDFTGRIDAQIAVADLGGLYRGNWDQFPRKPFLAADQARSALLRNRLKKKDEVVVGISWRSMNAKAGAHKSAQLEDLAPLLTQQGIQAIDLQYGDTGDERKNMQESAGISVLHYDDIDNTNDIDGLAALIDACDIVLTVSNTTAHIAGALGKPVWIMVPHGQGRIWYWFRDRKDSPWYPGARIVRQQPGQSWADLVASIAPEILEFARELKSKS